MVPLAGKEQVLVLATASADKKVKLWAAPSASHLSSWTRMLMHHLTILASLSTFWQLIYAKECCFKSSQLWSLPSWFHWFYNLIKAAWYHGKLNENLNYDELKWVQVLLLLLWLGSYRIIVTNNLYRHR